MPDKSPFKISEMVFKDDETISMITGDDAAVVSKILKPLAGHSVQDALELLDIAKKVILKCTLTHDEYNV